MPAAPVLDVLRVFCAPGGEHGNPLGVFLEGAAVPDERRQGIARDLGFSETVFVDDPDRGLVRIFTPAAELDFAGHPLVGTAWLLAREGRGVEALRPPAGEVGVRREGEATFITARAEWSPPFEHVELGSAAAVEALDGAPDGLGAAYCWAWLDEGAGRVRARAFAPAIDVPEDEATGSAALALCVRLGRPIEVLQGRGSRIAARPLAGDWAEVGGLAVRAERRPYPLG